MHSIQGRIIWFKLLSLLVVTAFCYVPYITSRVEAAWYNSSWQNRVKVEISPANVGSTLTNYPVYIDLSNLPAGAIDSMISGCGDIRVAESDEVTETAREVVWCNSTTDTGELHFLADSVSSSATTTFYIYYNNSGASDYATTSTYGAQNVWSDYEAVYHMEEDPSGNGTDAIKDSTVNTRDLTPSGAPTQDTSGKLSGNAIQFDGVNDKLADTGWDWPANNGAVSVTMWNYVPNTDIQNSSIFAWTIVGSERFQAHSPWGDGNVYFDYGTCCTTGRVNGTGYTAYDDKWTHTVFRAEGNSGGGQGMSIWLDGSSYASNANTDVPNTILADFEVAHSNTGSDNWHKGRIDEFRVRNDYLADNWVSAEYVNQNDSTSFYFVASAESAPSEGSSTSRRMRLFEGFTLKVQSGRIIVR